MKHSNVDVIRAWKDAEYRNQLSAEQLATLPANPIESADIDGSLLKGGIAREIEAPAVSGGWVCTISGECNGGSCCNPFTSR
ncbi:mersacidin/lichenicidin family type 2 lantibiotic [Chitinophaga tropicalis]|uniref:Mersacidin/lichenicidin family type 2 lantibiotic n=1 Tax=Chitinophaga tropicalis TaxID=2683588 RepID=A0A7K1UAW4_9BACT|nr:mersacidin/lichenicidin family type 2 lantibiotic [Chitinophaga tropicalis]MVT11436.1 mersacidin/lichenicidin family type 2 lantibiotic [Chitinophaga tropicalis]